MRNVAFLFAGQGAQYVGMGQDLYNNYEKVRDIFDRADNILDYALSDICLNGPSELLNQTENTQPAVYMMGYAIYSILDGNLPKPRMMAGLSLGEYTALTAAGSISFGDGINLVRQRARFMQEAVPLGKGAMAAILGLSTEDVKKCCDLSKSIGTVEAANYNSPGQIVISGEKEAVESACQHAKDLGAKRAILLPVSAPFHCSMLEPAAKRLGEELSNIDIISPNIKIISNVTAKPIAGKKEISKLLTMQVTNPVRWQESMEFAIAEGIDTFIELGPGRTLTSLLKRIDRNIEGYNIEDIESLERVLKEFGC